MFETRCGPIDIIVIARKIKISYKVSKIPENGGSWIEAIGITAHDPLASQIRGPLKIPKGIRIFEGNPVSNIEPVIKPRADVILRTILVEIALVSIDVINVIN